ELRADEAAADDEEARSLLRRLADAAIVVERPEVDDLSVVGREPARPAARREQEPLAPMRLAAIVERRVAVQVELDDPPAEEQLDAAEVGRAPPDRRFVLP